MPAEQARLIETALSISGPAGNALARLRALTAEGGADITPALDRFEARLAALEQAGVDAAALPFDAAFGRNLEYYEGFVFEITAQGRPELPPLAGGGTVDDMVFLRQFLDGVRARGQADLMIGAWLPLWNLSMRGSTRGFRRGWR